MVPQKDTQVKKYVSTDTCRIMVYNPLLYMKKRAASPRARGLLPLSLYRRLMDVGPLPTVDVLFFNSALTKTLLLKRAHKPLAGVYFSMGGHIRKNEKLLDAAIRQAFTETGIRIKKADLVFGGVQEEIHKDSIFPGVSYHSVDVFYGYVLTEVQLKNLHLDGQHSNAKWFPVFDRTLHPFIKTKLKSLLAAMR